MASLNAEEVAVLQFLHRQGGLCTMAEWKKFAGRERTKHEVLQRLIHRGKILAPGPGELYIISDTGYRSLKMCQKQSPPSASS
jgi:hypothetical protein